METERYFADATAQQLRDAAKACRFAERTGVDDDWDHHYALDARRLTSELGWSWDFTTWSHAATILEREAELAERDA
jgi:hypothetical protein